MATVSLAALGIVESQGIANIVSQLFETYSRHVTDENRAKNQLNLEEHLRRQPSHLGLDCDSQPVAYVKRKRSRAPAQRLIVSYSNSRLNLTEETQSDLLQLKRLRNRHSMKEVWVRLQTGAAPKLATRKPNGKGHWVTIPIVEGGAARGDGSSPSWVEVARLLGIDVPNEQGVAIHGPGHTGRPEQPPKSLPVPVPMAVLFALLAAGEDLKIPVEVSTSTREGCCTMRMGEVEDYSPFAFSRELNSGVVFKVTSSWTFAAMLD